MAKFVNYKKRDFTLPVGCNDLLDVLEPPRRAFPGQFVSASLQRPSVKEECFSATGLTFDTLRLGKALNWMDLSPAPPPIGQDRPGDRQSLVTSSPTASQKRGQSSLLTL